MRVQPLEPAPLEVEIRSGSRIAVRQIQAGEQHAVDRGLDVAALRIVRLTRQSAPGFMDRADPAEDGDPVPTPLAMPDRTIAKVAKSRFGELVLRRLQFLETEDVGLGSASQCSRTGSLPLIPFTL